MKLKINKKDCKISDYKIPKGYRPIEDWELLRELRKNTELKEIFKNGVWVNRLIGGEEVIRASWLGIFFGISSFDADGHGVGDSGRLRGVFVKKQVT